MAGPAVQVAVAAFLLDERCMEEGEGQQSPSATGLSGRLKSTMKLNWGDIPSGVGAVLTGLSLLIAAFSYRRSVKNSEMAQAELVTSWIENDDKGNAIIVVHNASNLPIYMLTAYLREPLEPDKRFYIGTLLPNSKIENETRVWMKSALPPDRVEFSDAAGRHWTRFDSGDLKLSHYRLHCLLQNISNYVRHPIPSLKRVLPSRYPQPSHINSHTQDLAVKAAIWEGCSEKKARSAISKYINHRRLTRSEKRALDTAMRMVRGLRPPDPAGHIPETGESHLAR